MDKGPKLADALERAAQQVKQAYSECPAYDVVSDLAANNGACEHGYDKLSSRPAGLIAEVHCTAVCLPLLLTSTCY